MDAAALAISVPIAAATGWLAATWQHVLYSRPEHRVRDTGRSYWLRRVALALAAIVVVGLALRPDHYDLFPAILSAIFGVVLVVLASTDFERRLLPNTLTYPAIVAAVAFCWAWPDRSIADVFIGGAVGAGAGIGLVVVGALLFGGKGAIPFGMGDAKLMLLIGLLLGWPAMLSGLLIGMILGGIPGLVMTVAGRGRSVFSYGPFLVAGALVVLLFPDRFV